jgi:NADH dehydrogenase [ubiquinone] 1 alpha subcomplex assembly factor 5
MEAPPQIFDRSLVRQHRDRVARQGHKHILGEIVAEEIVDRLSAIKRDFSMGLVLGGNRSLAAAIRGRVDICVEADLALRRDVPHPAAIVDEEVLPFAEGSFDLVVSTLSLHWLNDLPGALIQIRRSLKPDGLFLGALLGGETLHELRTSLSEAEIETRGGLSPHFSPTIDLRDMGALLQRAGFALPVVDTDKFAMRFETPLELIAALRDSAETNALIERARRPLSRQTLSRMLEIYASRFAASDGGVRALFEVIYLTAWSPHESQQKPLAPGSARMRLSEALGAKEQTAGEKAAPHKS